MKLSDGVEWGVHVCTLLAVLPPDSALPAARLAEYHGVPSAYLAKHLQALAGAGVLDTVKGPRGGYRLARPPAEITVLDVVEAIDGAEPPFRCAEIRRRGPAAVAAREYKLPCGIHRAFTRADAVWRKELADTTIASLAIGVIQEAPRAAVEKATRWLGEAMR
ncbi:MAG TPA: Rrf2 family transcriptional regulator [Acidimicrobiia bacterium]|nr:Rrf2 family transcriptional regulator [Acidimicrobiia bacterium]